MLPSLSPRSAMPARSLPPRSRCAEYPCGRRGLPMRLHQLDGRVPAGSMMARPTRSRGEADRAKPVARGKLDLPGGGTFIANAMPDPFDGRDFEYQPRLRLLPATLDQRFPDRTNLVL